jgi:hypothetical protein
MAAVAARAYERDLEAVCEGGAAEGTYPWVGFDKLPCGRGSVVGCTDSGPA